MSTPLKNILWDKVPYPESQGIRIEIYYFLEAETPVAAVFPCILHRLPNKSSCFFISEP